MFMFTDIGCCEKIEKCPFFNKYFPEKDGLYRGWAKSFCENMEKSQDCKRKQYSIEHNQPAPPELTPIGTLIDNSAA